MKNRISVIGTGYVGLVTGACLSDFGLEVICVDKDTDKINKLKEGIIPIFEPGLEDVVFKNVEAGRLLFTTDTKWAVENSDVIFIAVGTPPNEDGSADLQYVEAVAAEIARYMNGYKVVVDKSTVPVGTGQLVKSIINKEMQGNYSFDVVSNPEFLREGAAVGDFMRPDRIVIGCESEKAAEIMKNVYRVLYLNEVPFVITNIETAEMIKYASNAFLAVKITFINEIANLCEKVGADVKDVAIAMGKDGRIGSKFLHPGPGYGGSCFPKDTLALAQIGRKYDSRISLVETTVSANHSQKLKMVDKIKEGLGFLEGRSIGVLGLAFKPGTDDMREAPAITIISELCKNGAFVKGYDPAAMEEAKWRLGEVANFELVANEYEAVKNVDAVVILTEWNQFRSLDLDKVKSLLKEPNFFDLRNIYDRRFMEDKGFRYFAVGR